MKIWAYFSPRVVKNTAASRQKHRTRTTNRLKITAQMMDSVAAYAAARSDSEDARHRRAGIAEVEAHADSRDAAAQRVHETLVLVEARSRIAARNHRRRIAQRLKKKTAAAAAAAAPAVAVEAAAAAAAVAVV